MFKRIMTKGSRAIVAVLTLVLVSAAVPAEAASAEILIKIYATNMNTSVSVPTQIPIIFNEDGTNTYPENWVIKNESSIAGIYLHQVRMDSGDTGWKVLASTIDTAKLPADTKSMKFSMGRENNLKLVNPGGGTENKVGVLIYNKQDIQIPVGEETQIHFNVERGAFTESADMQKAFDMELSFLFI